MQLKQYQEEAIKELLEKAQKLLQKTTNKSIVFKSPTGSGKTIMMAEFLKQVCNLEEFKNTLAFIWTAPRTLHIQSKKKLSQYYQETRALDCLEFEELDDRKIDCNEILFFNWESINKENNIYIRENERKNNLSSVISRTKTSGNKIILIIDESHHGAPSPKSQDLIRDIAPDLTIEVSATPDLNNPDEFVSVDIDDVKVEGMIKKSVKLNDGFITEMKENNILSNEQLSSDEIVLKEALKKREELLKLYKEIGIDINPLVLIQLPDRQSGKKEKLKQEIIKKLDSDYNISEENGNLGIWLSEDKTGLEGITDIDSQIEVLIFKQAIAIGWDCPRSHILILFREWSSARFSIQTLGRIMRVADPKQGHYISDYEPLNHAYVFTNLPEIALDDDISKSYTTIYKSERKSIYELLKINSWYRVRQREKTRLSPLFLEVFGEELKKYKLHEKIDKTNQTVKKSVLPEFIIENIDKLQDTTIEGDIVNVKNEKDLQDIFDKFIEDSLKEEPHFHPEDRSVSNLKQSIYNFFSEHLNLECDKNFAEIIRIILSDNKAHFLSVIELAKKSYLDKVRSREEELEKKTWDVPEFINYNQEYQKHDVKKSIMNPFYSRKNSSTPEKKFIKFLESNNKVKWWFKNGEKDGMFFAVPYEKDDRELLFYIDFIVQLEDGRIGLFDTKGIKTTAPESKEKVKGLKEYINQKLNIFGGIIVFKNEHWKIYKETGQEFDVEKEDNWEPLIF
ncbi:MAG: DEAD/DEAH box helicase family protein [Oligoflexia bacterium]|nr:DEAD/DEAH box helicase family protein [Oligoflexia bacterium]